MTQCLGTGDGSRSVVLNLQPVCSRYALQSQREWPVTSMSVHVNAAAALTPRFLLLNSAEGEGK